MHSDKFAKNYMPQRKILKFLCGFFIHGLSSAVPRRWSVVRGPFLILCMFVFAQ